MYDSKAEQLSEGLLNQSSELSAVVNQTMEKSIISFIQENDEAIEQIEEGMSLQ